MATSEVKNITQWNFKDLSVLDFSDHSGCSVEILPSRYCRKLACRTCSSCWILDDLRNKLTKRPTVIGEVASTREDESSSTAKCKTINDHFYSLTWISNRRPGILLPAWNDEESQNIFSFFSGFPMKRDKETATFANEESRFEIDSIYLNGHSLTIMESFLHGNFKSESKERLIFQEKTVFTALEKLKRDQIITQTLLEMHNCPEVPINYLLFFPFVTIDKILQIIKRSQECKLLLQESNLNLGMISSDILYSRKIHLLEFFGEVVKPKEQDIFAFLDQNKSDANEDWSSGYRHLTSSLIISKKMATDELKFCGTTERSSGKSVDCRGQRSLEESKTTNESMTTIISMWREPPSAEEIIEHERVVEGLSQQQQLAINCLQDIIKTEKNAEFLMSGNSSTKSSLDLLPMLMTNEWFSPSDLKTCEVSVRKHLLSENKNASKDQWENRLLDESLFLQESISQALNIIVARVLVTPPPLTGMGYNIKPKGKFSVTVNGKDSILPKSFVLSNPRDYLHDQQTVLLKNVENAKANQIPVFQLKPEDLDSMGDFEFSSSGTKIQRRGGMEYKQPGDKWIRVGLRVTGRYDNGNDDWLAMNGNPNEWAVGFHGSKTIEGNQGIATSREIRPGKAQAYETFKDINELSDNKGRPCGSGSYFSDDIETSAAKYSGSINGRLCVFQARLRPDKIRIPEPRPDYRIVTTAKFARPYGICVKI